jgi:hypothetical protein
MDLENGDTDRVTVVWPAVEGETVTVDAPPIDLLGGRVVGGNPWRIPDVPVE